MSSSVFCTVIPVYGVKQFVVSENEVGYSILSRLSRTFCLRCNPLLFCHFVFAEVPSVHSPRLGTYCSDVVLKDSLVACGAGEMPPFLYVAQGGPLS